MGKASYSCSSCPFIASSKRVLDEHMGYKHTIYEERRFACPDCSKKFVTKWGLTEHTRHMHTFEKPFACKLCDAKFTVSPKLTRHIRYIHTKEKPVSCSECDMKFTTPHDRKLHFTRMHTAQGQQRQKKKEEKLAKFLQEKGFQYQREYKIDFTCFQGTYARVDFILQLQNCFGEAFIVLLENDEEAHSSRPVSCEVKRMMDVVSSFTMDGNTLPILWVRFNCDTFRIDGTVQKKKQAERFEGLETFLHRLEEQHHPSFAIHYLFYDCLTIDHQPQLELFSNEDYHEEIKQYVQVHV
jgi:hypothetical protein